MKITIDSEPDFGDPEWVEMMRERVRKRFGPQKKHLQGEHDQDDHGNRGPALRDSSRDPQDDEDEDEDESLRSPTGPETPDEIRQAKAPGFPPRYARPTKVYKGVPLHLGKPGKNVPEKLVKLAEKAIDDALAAGLVMPTAIGVTDKIPWTEGTYARYDPETRAVQLCDAYFEAGNLKGAPYGTHTDAGLRGAELAFEGYLSQPNIVLHELSHAQHFQSAEGRAALKKMGIDPDGKRVRSGIRGVRPTTEDHSADGERVAGRVSEYARRDKIEFVAEVMAGALSGKRYPDEVMDYFERCGGRIGHRTPHRAREVRLQR